MTKEYRQVEYKNRIRNVLTISMNQSDMIDYELKCQEFYKNQFIDEMRIEEVLE